AWSGNRLLGQLAMPSSATWTHIGRLVGHRCPATWTADGRIAGVEVKASASVTSSDFRGLCYLQSQAGDNFAAGVVLYAGDASLSFGTRLKALPVSALWRL